LIAQSWWLIALRGKKEAGKLRSWEVGKVRGWERKTLTRRLKADSSKRKGGWEVGRLRRNLQPITSYLQN
jgi:hypothetical protein